MEKLKTSNININYWELAKDKVAKAFKDFYYEVVKKNQDIVFHPTNNQMSPTPDPITTTEQFPTTNNRFLEFFNINTTQTGVTVYCSIKASITVINFDIKFSSF